MKLPIKGGYRWRHRATGKVVTVYVTQNPGEFMVATRESASDARPVSEATLRDEYDLLVPAGIYE